MSTLLADKEALLVTDDFGHGKLIPMPELLGKFELLHFFLEEVVRDWKRASDPYQAEIDKLPLGTISQASLRAFDELQPIILKCIFSYVLFFVAADTAYYALYTQLNKANEITGLFIKHGKPPKKTETINKLRKVCNRSIAHIPSTQVNKIDALAAISWQPLIWELSGKNKLDLGKVRFGAFRRVIRASDGSVVEQSEDISLPGISELHAECMNYLEKFDRICADYLAMLQDRMTEIA